jgi:hypothetical protein
MDSQVQPVLKVALDYRESLDHKEQVHKDSLVVKVQ